MTRRPLCIVCLLLILSMCIADRAGIPLIRGNPVPDNISSWIKDHPRSVICGEVLQTTENEFSQAVYLGNTYLIYKSNNNQKINQSKKIPIENIKAFMKKKEDVPAGTVVLMSGNLEPVAKIRNPGEFDGEQYYSSQHIFYFLKKAELLEKSENYSVYRKGVCDLRSYLGTILNRIAGKEAGIFQAIVLGDKSNLEQEVKLRYQMGGIVHVLAISGLHISMLGLGLYNLLMKTGMGIWPSGIISLLLLLQYGIMTGGSVSTMRAVCMFLVAIGAKITGRIYDLPTALAVSAMLILADSGAYLYTSGFLLSFSAVVGAGVVVPVLNGIFQYSKQDKKGISGICAKTALAFMASLGIQLTMLPVSLYFFGEVSLIGMLLNLIVLPTVGIVLGSGVTGLMVGCMSWKLGSVAVLPGRLLAEIYEELCKLSGRLPFCTWITGQPTLWQVAVYYILLAGALAIFAYRKRGRKNIRAGHKFTGLILIGLALTILVWRGKEPFSVTCLDVGQGDGIVLRTPENQCFLIDGGSSSKTGVGQYQLLPYLKNQGISRVDGIFISHTDQDHISGIKEILELTASGLNSVKIGCLYLPEWKKPPEAWQKLETLADEAGITVKNLKSGEILRTGKLRLKVLAPFEEASGMDVNEDGMVLQAEYEDFRGLFTGDIGEETEKKLLARGLLENVDFLKVGHHGSHYSTCQQFLDTVSPEYGVISCSLTNTYGHPSAETIQRLEAAGCETGFTMRNGAVRVCWENGKIKFEKYLQDEG